jgi:hypothetical protein
MIRAALALLSLGVAAPAAAGTWRATAELAGEVDSNVTRAEQGGEGAPVGAALVRGGGEIAGAGATGWGRWSLRGGADLRVVGDGAIVGEDLAALTGELRGDRAVGDRPVRLGVRAGAYDVVGLDGDAARAFRWMFAETSLVLADGTRRAALSIGVRDFTYKPEPRLDWRGPTLALALSSEAWRGGDADAPTTLEVFAHAGLEVRGYDALSFADACPPGSPPSRACLGTVGEERSDLHHRVVAGATYTGDRVYAADYELTVNDSASHRQSWVRHRVTVSATTGLPLGLLATARASVQVDQYLDPLAIPDDTRPQSVTSIDDDNRSSVSVLLARRLGARWTAEARWAFWTDALADDDLAFRRHLVSLGVTWTSG